MEYIVKPCIFLNLRMNKLNNRIYLVFILLIVLEGCSIENKENTAEIDSTSVSDTTQTTQKIKITEPAFKKYNLRSGIITFEVLGREPGSSKKVYFDNFGNKE